MRSRTIGDKASIHEMKLVYSDAADFGSAHSGIRIGCPFVHFSPVQIQLKTNASRSSGVEPVLQRTNSGNSTSQLGSSHSSESKRTVSPTNGTGTTESRLS